MAVLKGFHYQVLVFSDFFLKFFLAVESNSYGGGWGNCEGTRGGSFCTDGNSLYFGWGAVYTFYFVKTHQTILLKYAYLLSYKVGFIKICVQNQSSKACSVKLR